METDSAVSCTNLNPEQLLSGLQFALMVRGGTLRLSTMKADPMLGRGRSITQRGSEFKRTQCNHLKDTCGNIKNLLKLKFEKKMEVLFLLVD